MANRRKVDYEARGAYWMMVLPAFIIYLLVMAFPIVLSIVLSVSNYSGGQMFGGTEKWGFAGFGAYAKVFADPLFWNALKNNMYIVAVSVFGQIPLGFFFAYIIFRRTVRWPDFWQSVLYVPNIISVIVVALLWQTVFSPHGPLAEVMNAISRHSFEKQLNVLFAATGAAVNGTFAPNDSLVTGLLKLVGTAGANMFENPFPELKDLLLSFQGSKIPEVMQALCNLFVPGWSPEFLNRPDVAMLPVLFVILWMYTGMYLILFLANMQKIDVQIIEAARIDGARESQVMNYIILPALTGTIVNSAILAISGSLSSFALVFAMTGGGPNHVTEILAIYMYNKAFLGASNFPLANAISLIMVLISFILIIITKQLEKRFGGKEE